MLKALARREKSIRRLLILSLLYLILPIRAMQPINDPDIWWHLRIGQWIAEHGAVPMTDYFSSYGMGKPWIAYSWLFELLVYGLYRAFGLVGLVLYSVILGLMITAALHALVRKCEPPFWIEIAITTLGISSITPMLTPRPWLFTILFFIIQLDILFATRRSGDPRGLLLLAPLFALWANIHIQFVYGLFVLGLATAEPIIDRLLGHPRIEGDARTIPFSRLLFITAACAVATLATPYHLHLYGVILEYIRQTGPFQYIYEFMALRFRNPADWFVLFATVGAAFALGWRREVRPFPLLLLAAGCFLSFRARRDVWFVVVTAVTILATLCSTGATTDRFALTKLRAMFVTVLVIAVLIVVGRIRNISERHLEAAVAKVYPVEATAVVEKHGYPGPLYNHLDWGGYLIWRLPNLPVAMDGRTNLHGNERIERSLETWLGGNSWSSDPELGTARLVIANTEQALASLLRFDPRFELTYEDELAAVFIATPKRKGQ